MLPFSDPPLSPAAYRFLADLVYRQSRIRLGADKQALVAGRLGRRLETLGCGSFEEYCGLLESPGGEDEISLLVDLISTNHTHFFREAAHFDILAERVLPAVAARAVAEDRDIRVWCAAAASGEEAYSLAIVLAEFCGTRPAPGWRVFASDISRRMLDVCRKGIYEADKVNLPDPALLPRHFLNGVGERQGFYRVKADLRRRVTTAHVNLFQADYPVPRGLDVVFCRNVMIYFDVESRRALVERLYEQLAPGGYLFVGHSESLLGLGHGFRPAGPSVYVRPA
ncbi:MAG: CheR family methyltransferase [Planctomycetia bacterium]